MAELERLRKLEAAAQAYCDCIDEIGASGEPPRHHMERLDELESATRAHLRQRRN